MGKIFLSNAPLFISAHYLFIRGIFLNRGEDMLNGLFVRQVGQQYLIYTPQGIQVGYVFLGQDGQYAKDVVVLNAVTKALAKRWGLSDKKN